MKTRNLAVAIALAVGSLGFVAVGQAARYVDVDVGVAREGHIYEPGHYEWNGAEYVWVEGQFVRDREGHE